MAATVFMTMRCAIAGSWQGKDEWDLVPALERLLGQLRRWARLVYRYVTELFRWHWWGHKPRGGSTDSGRESGKAAWRGRHLHAQSMWSTHNSSQVGKQGPALLPWEHLGCRERNSCVSHPPAEKKELEDVAFPINPAASVFLDQLSSPSWDPEEWGREALNNIIKILPRKRLKLSWWEAHRSMGTKGCELRMWGRNGSCLAPHWLVEQSGTGLHTCGPWLPHL